MSSRTSVVRDSDPLSTVGLQKVVFFPEGPGYIFISKLDLTGLSKLMIVRSVEDNKLYVRKESHPYIRDAEQIIQSADVRAVKEIQHINAIPRLLGWIEYEDEVRSNNVITASIWELCDAGSLLGIRDDIQQTMQPATEKVLFSLWRQMLRVMLDTIQAGILHVDAHADNWFVSIVNGDREVKVMLGDWGLWERRPDMEEHQPSELGQNHISNCALCQWYRSCHVQLGQQVVAVARDLVCCNEQVKTSKINRAGPRSSHANTDTRPLNSLQEHLEVIEASKPQSHETGKAWLQRVEEAYKELSRDEARLAAASSVPGDDCGRFRRHHVITAPTFDEALGHLDSYGRDPVHLWKVAQVDLRTNTVVALEGRPDGYRKEIGYSDYTALDQLPSTWRQAHDQTKGMLRRWGVEEEQPENEGRYGWQDEESVTGYIDTSMPF